MKKWYMFTVKYYSETKKNERMPFAASWMYLEIVMLSEVSQTEKEKYCIISHYTWNFTKLTHRNRD